jgi:hypothetical protein
MNVSLTGSKKSLGKGNIPLNSFVASIDKLVPFQIPLMLEKGGQKGVISGVVCLTVDEDNKSSEEKSNELIKVEEVKPLVIPKEMSNHVFNLALSDMQAHELENTGHLLDKQDPCLKVTIGSQYFTTERRKDSGINAIFPEIFKFSLTAEEIMKSVPVMT